MTIEQVRRDMAWLTSKLDSRLGKYRRNYNRFANNGRRAEDIREQYGSPLAFQGSSVGEGTGITPNLNTIKSNIDTHISKLSQTKVRPFFNPLVGTFKARKVTRAAQVYFDEFYEQEDVYRKGIRAAKFADIFEYGAVWVDEEIRKLYALPPWEYLVDAAEYNYGKVSRCLILQKQYPLWALRDHLKGSAEAETLKARLTANPFAKVERAWYYDLIGKEKHLFADAVHLTTKKIEYGIPPVAVIYLEQPMKGVHSVSIADDLYPIQLQIDTLCERIHLALELSPANTIWVPEGSEVKASMLSNEIGAVYKYRPLPGVTAGVVVATPPPIDPAYLNHLEFWLRQSYEITGISQLSAQAKKPSGLNSGVALQTVEDVESERHNPMLQSYVRFLMDIAKVCMEVFPQGEDILPKKVGRARIQWSDIKRERDSFSIQFSASSSLSKDPKVKMEQVEKLVGMGYIDKAFGATLLEFPDLESAYSILTSSFDYCQRIIERAVEEDKYEFYEVVDLQQLFSETANTLLRLDANEEKPEVLERLVILLRIVKSIMDEVNAAIAPPPAPQPEQQAPPLAGPAAEVGASSPQGPEVLPPPSTPSQVINVNLGGSSRKVTVRRGAAGELLGADVEEEAGAEAAPEAAPEALPPA